jgi:hypothetical protein
MRQIEALIERVKQVNTQHQHIELVVDEAMARIKPGQSLLARFTESNWQPYLREHWWPVGIVQGQNKLLIERPTSEQYQPGQVIDIMGLVGRPYRFRRNLRNVLLIAYDTPPTPLLMIIPWLLGNRISVTLVLVGSAASYGTSHVSPEVEVVHGDTEFVWPNQVMTVGWADQVFVTVAQDNQMERFRSVYDRFQELRANLPQNYLFGTFDPILPCGEGACQACMVNTRSGPQLICTEGPAMDLTQVILP